MLKLEYAKILVFLVVVFCFVFLLVALSWLLTKDLNLSHKKKPVECGSQAFGSGKNRIEVNFYIIAIIFVIFEVELIIILPWLLFLWESFWFSFWPATLFLFILCVGLVFEYLKGTFKLD